jgi:hypothetical protein
MDQRRGWGEYSLYFGLVMVVGVVLFRGSAMPSRESESGSYGYKVDLSFRWSMSWFIFSEVMFFGAFFTALWWAGAFGAGARQPRERAVVARLQGGVAQRRRRCHRLAGRHRRAVPDHGSVLAAHDQHRACC